MDKEKLKEASALALFLISAVILLMATGDDIGLTWDEPFQYDGEVQVQWFSTLSRSIQEGRPADAFNREVIDAFWTPANRHPPFAIFIYGLFKKTFEKHLGIIAAPRAGGAFFSAFLLLGVFLMGKAAGGPFCGWFSMAALLLMPRAFGHMHLAALDVPIAALTIWCAYSFYRGLESLRWSILLGIFFGLALSTKNFAPLILPPLLVWGYISQGRKCHRNLAFLLTLSPLVFYMTWPWLWPQPVERFLDYLTFHIRHFNVNTYYWGVVFRGAEAPWHYPFVTFIVTTPVFTLLLIMLGAVVIAGKRFQSRAGGLIMISAIFPLAVMAYPGLPNYDGVRLFLPALPFMAVLAGAGTVKAAESLSKLTGKGLKAQRPAGAFLLGAFLLVNTASTAGTAPFYLSYYNALIGGLKGAQRAGFEVTYWGDAINEEVLDYLNGNAAAGDTVSYAATGAGLLFYQLDGKLRRDITVSRLNKYDRSFQSDYIVLNSRLSVFNDRLWNLYNDQNPRYRQVHEVTHEGVTLVKTFRKIE
jgi:4-amino-4-deoxy-L-arabinose transferase-like glycosyltransferase